MDDLQSALFSATSEHAGSDCAGGGARERRVFPARSAGLPWAAWAPATARSRLSWVCARGAAGPVAALTRSPGRARRGRPVPGGQDASRWLLPGGQRGLCAAVRARGRGGRIKVAVAWQRARGLGRLRRRHQPPPGTPARCPRCPRPASPAAAASACTVSQLMPATGSERYAIPGPAPDDRPVPAAVAPGHRRAEGRDPGRPAPHARPPGRGRGTGGRHLRFHRHGQVGLSPRHRRAARTGRGTGRDRAGMARPGWGPVRHRLMSGCAVTGAGLSGARFPWLPGARDLTGWPRGIPGAVGMA